VSGARGLDLLILGDCNPDLVLADPDLQPSFGQVERLVDDAQLTIGGSGAIMACAAARLGLRTAIAAVVGDDLFGRFMVDALDERAVDTSAIVVDSELRTGLSVILARSGDRAILTYTGAITALSAERIDPELLASARHVHVSSYFQQTALAPGLARLLAGARRAGKTTSLDPNWDPREEWDAGLRELLPALDVLMPNAAEVCRIAGNDDPRRAAQELAEMGPVVTVKLGADGAIAARAGEELIAATAPSGIESVDAIGAGDTFDAGLLAGRLGGAGIEDSLALACACGTLSTRAMGGTEGQPTLAQAQAAIA